MPCMSKMNRKKALEILELPQNIRSKPLHTHQDCLKQYRKLALKWHPDKNGNTQESHDKFIQLTSAYEFLTSATTAAAADKESKSYMSILQDFMAGKLSQTTHHAVVKNLVTIIANSQITNALLEQVFRTSTKDVALAAYTFLYQCRDVLNLSAETLEEIKAVVIKLFEVTAFTIQPTFRDVMKSQLYKFQYMDELYLVPLWNTQSVFTLPNGSDMIIICEPILPEGVTIDDDGNVHVQHTIFASDLLERMTKGHICVWLTEGVQFHIPMDELFMKPVQVYTLYGEGIQLSDADAPRKIQSNVHITVRIFDPYSSV